MIQPCDTAPRAWASGWTHVPTLALPLSWLVATGSDSSACASLAPSAWRGNVAQTCKFIMEFKTVTAMYPASRGHFSYSVCCRPQGAGDLPDCQ